MHSSLNPLSLPHPCRTCQAIDAHGAESEHCKRAIYCAVTAHANYQELCQLAGADNGGSYVWCPHTAAPREFNLGSGGNSATPSSAEEIAGDVAAAGPAGVAGFHPFTTASAAAAAAATPANTQDMALPNRANFRAEASPAPQLPPNETVTPPQGLNEGWRPRRRHSCFTNEATAAAHPPPRKAVFSKNKKKKKAPARSAVVTLDSSSGEDDPVLPRWQKNSSPPRPPMTQQQPLPKRKRAKPSEEWNDDDEGGQSDSEQTAGVKRRPSGGDTSALAGRWRHNGSNTSLGRNNAVSATLLKNKTIAKNEEKQRSRHSRPLRAEDDEFASGDDDPIDGRTPLKKKGRCITFDHEGSEPVEPVSARRRPMPLLDACQRCRNEGATADMPERAFPFRYEGVGGAAAVKEG